MWEGWLQQDSLFVVFLCAKCCIRMKLKIATQNQKASWNSVFVPLLWFFYIHILVMHTHVTKSKGFSVLQHWLFFCIELFLCVSKGWTTERPSIKWKHLETFLWKPTVTRSTRKKKKKEEKKKKPRSFLYDGRVWNGNQFDQCPRSLGHCQFVGRSFSTRHLITKTTTMWKQSYINWQNRGDNNRKYNFNQAQKMLHCSRKATQVGLCRNGSECTER